MKRAIQPFGNEIIRLRLLTEADLEMSRGWRNRDEVRIWFKSTQKIGSDQNRIWFTQYAERDDDFLFVVEARGEPVGQASIYGINWQEGTAEIGRFIAAPGASGRGFVGMACGELVRFAGDTLKLRYIFLEVKENNEKAIRIYLRNGFHEENRVDGLIRMGCPLHQNSCGNAS